MNLKVPGALLPLGWLILSTRAKTVWGVVVTPLVKLSQAPGGVLIGKVGTGMCGPDRVLFRALRFCNGPFFI